MDYAATRGQKTGMLLGKAADAVMGVEDEEAAVERLIRDSDMETQEGRDALLKEVGKISPDAFAELQTQMNQTAVANATTANTLMNSENQLIAHKQKIFGGKYAREFEREAGPSGEGFSIHYFLQKNEIDFDPAKVKTIAQAEALIKKHMGKDSSYKDTQKQLNSYVGLQREMFITMRATQDAGVEMTSGSPETSATPNNFDATIPTDTSETSTGSEPEDFNPATTPQGESFKATIDGNEGTWIWKKGSWVGDQDGYEVKAGWKFYPDTDTNYTDEGAKFSVPGMSTVTADQFNELYDF
jgi:hypothetical protein